MLKKTTKSEPKLPRTIYPSQNTALSRFLIVLLVTNQSERNFNASKKLSIALSLTH